MKEFPEKWCTKLNRAEVVEYCNKHGKIPPYYIGEVYAHFPPYQRGCTTSVRIKPGYTEITFKDFEKHILEEEAEPMKTFNLEELVDNNKVVVFIENREQWQKLKDTELFRLCPYYGRYCYALFLGEYSSDSSATSAGIYESQYLGISIVQFNQIDFTQVMEKEIIGWKLKENCKQFEKAIDSIIKKENNFPLFGENTTLSEIGQGCSIELLKEARVLELWFTPIYKEIVPKIEIKGYVAEFLPEDKVKFGCQTYTKDFIVQLNNLLIKQDFMIIYNGTPLNPEINELASYLQKC